MKQLCNILGKMSIIGEESSCNIRSILTKIIFGILPLHIETVRFRGTALEERTCQIWNSQSKEDECHFILICNQYNELRINLFNSVKYKVETFEYLDNREMFFHIMKYEWKLLSKYLIKHGPNGITN